MRPMQQAFPYKYRKEVHLNNGQGNTTENAPAERINAEMVNEQGSESVDRNNGQRAEQSGMQCTLCRIDLAPLRSMYLLECGHINCKDCFEINTEGCKVCIDCNQHFVSQPDPIFCE